MSSSASAAAPSCEATSTARSLEQVCTPSRASIALSKPKKGIKKPREKEEVEKPDFKAPPPATPAERKEWDRMSVRMNSFHEYFRQSFRQMWILSDSFAAKGYTTRDFLALCEDFELHLEGHHGIEERYIFPVLAQRLPEFGEEHPQEHEAIHAGLDKFSAYVRLCKQEPTSYDAEKFKDILAIMGPILFHHLDAEVETLKGDNLRRYYTLAEVRRLPM